ncbi:type II secretion system protein [Clostridium sp. 'deep sea']|uniref:type II secretion system protein n=1 Tax=Clostridium sp. 'deep sea' TaxID=2779445 RepID=UPI0018967915|nr:type II secretion system protein [Clostridium sp. 'deep sea']QOR35914.1 type II secretion system protein [Clostridium sp. 'deep sea']
MIIRKKLSNKAYTYIELLGVLAIVILVVTPLLYMINSVYDKSLKSHALTQANNVIASIMDRATFDVKHNGYLATRLGEIKEQEYTYYNIPQGYLVSLNISQNNNHSNLFEINIELTFKDINIESKSLVLYE